MSISSWFPWRRTSEHKGQNRSSHSPASRRRSTRLICEQLEDRTVPSNFTAATVSDLIADINLANQYGGANTITLTAPTASPYTLTAVDNAVDGQTGLPVIAANDNLTIEGNGDTIARSTASSTPYFRLLDVASGASLTLENLTLQGGRAPDSRGWNMGGGIFNQGALDLKGVTVQNNTAYAYNDPAFYLAGPAPALGGGIYSKGSLTLEAGTIIRANQAIGAQALPYWGGQYVVFGAGGGGAGGGVYVAGGTATLTDVTVSSNVAQGGPGIGMSFVFGKFFSLRGRGGSAGGGGLLVYGGTVTLTRVTLSSNSALGGVGFQYGGNAGAGGLEITGGTVTTVTLTSDIVSSNSAVGGSAIYSGGGGSALVGGVFIHGTGATVVTLQSDTVTGNSAQGGSGSKGNGTSRYGGIFIDIFTTVYLDVFTLNHTKGNTPDDIYGSYILI